MDSDSEDDKGRNLSVVCDSSDDINSDVEDVVVIPDDGDVGAVRGDRRELSKTAPADHSDDLSVAQGGGAGEGQGHHLCELPLPSTSNPVRPIGGSVSTNTAVVSKRASDDQVLELVEAFVRRGEETSCDTTVVTRGDSNKEVHVHLTQTNIHNPAAVALGGPVVVNPPKKKEETSETPRPPTEKQKLRGETERFFDKWTEGMVKTRSIQAVLSKISQGRTWITIKGSPGEGKTTAGYYVLKHLHNMGRQVYDIRSPEEYSKVKDAKQPVLMLNDIFGSFHFDLGKLKTWESVLNDILSLNEHRGKEMDERDKTKPRLTVILISRSSVLKAASQHLGRFRDLVLNEESVVDFSNRPDVSKEERMKIWKHHSDMYHIHIDEKVVRKVCQMSLPHGFPHCCRLFAAMYSKNKHLDMKAFFSKPLEFLNQTIESLMMDAEAGQLLREMLRHDGSLQLVDVTDDERRYQYASVVETLTGTYLKQERGTVTFHHPSVYDSAAFVVCKKDPLFVIKHCTLSFLNERVNFQGLDQGMETEIQKRVTIDEGYVSLFLDRLKMEFEKENILLTLSHRSFHDEGFVSRFMQCILPSNDVQPLSDSVRHLIDTRDRFSKASFLYLMTKSGSDKILKYVTQIVELSHEQQADTLFGICEHSSVQSLKYFFRNYTNTNLNVKNLDSETLLLVASRKSSENIMKLLLGKDIDINSLDKEGNSSLHNICRHGVDGDGSVVKLLIEKGADVNIESLHYPHFPIHVACWEGHRNVVEALLESGTDVDASDRYGETPLTYACWMRHVDVVTVLLDREADVNMTDCFGQTPLNRPCEEGHVDVVTVLLDRGADVNKTDRGGITPLSAACYNGQVDVVTVLLDRGADVNKTDGFGETPLHGACYNGNVDIVTVLLDRGSDLNKIDRLGRTPLFRACEEGHVDVVTVLLDRGADVNKRYRGGETPLHRACYNGHVDVVTVLLDRGADVNNTNRDGDTPLDIARANDFWGNDDLRIAFSS